MFWSFGGPNLDWLQVEVSSICNAKCAYCPRRVLGERWASRLLPEPAFERLLENLDDVGHVHLQGWGEPLNHPDFARLVRSVKARGPAVGTTTNGVLLTRELAKELALAGLDVIAFSVAGVDEMADRFREGAPLSAVRRAVGFVKDAKARLDSATPAIHIAFMLLRSGLPDLERIPGFLASLGVDQAVVSSLSIMVDPSLQDEATLARDQSEFDTLERRLIKIREEARLAGCELHFHLALPFRQPALTCPENVGRAAVVSSSGQVMPCVLAGMPVEPPPVIHASDGSASPKGARFGSLLDDSLPAIWRRKDYRAWRRAWRRGRTPPSCVSCPKLHISDLRQHEPLDLFPHTR